MPANVDSDDVHGCNIMPTSDEEIVNMLLLTSLRKSPEDGYGTPRMTGKHIPDQGGVAD